MRLVQRTPPRSLLPSVLRFALVLLVGVGLGTSLTLMALAPRCAPCAACAPPPPRSACPPPPRSACPPPPPPPDDDVAPLEARDATASFVCGAVAQQPVEVRVDEFNGERRPWTRPQWIWHKGHGQLPAAWTALDASLRDGMFVFANEGVMHAMDDVRSNASYYCGLVPHVPLPWSVTFRTYEAWRDNPARGAPAPPDVADEAHAGARPQRDALPPAPPPITYANYSDDVRWSRYAPADVAIGVYTGARFLRTRASAVRDTYLARHPAHRVFFFTGAPDTLGLFEAVSVAAAGETYNSALYKQLHALAHMWQEARDAAWFYVIGCDTYVVIDYLLTTLDPYDSTEPHILGCCAGPYNLRTIGRPDESVVFGSGGAGILLSNALMAKLVPTLGNFLENVWNKNVPAVDVATAYAAKLVGSEFGIVSNMFATSPERALKHYHPGVELENSVWHYLHPTKVFDLDEFYVHQKIDRLAREPGRAAKVQLLRLFREFVRVHFETLRRGYYERRVLAAMLGDQVTETRFAPTDEEILSKQHREHLDKIKAKVRQGLDFHFDADNRDGVL